MKLKNIKVNIFIFLLIPTLMSFSSFLYSQDYTNTNNKNRIDLEVIYIGGDSDIQGNIFKLNWYLSETMENEIDNYVITYIEDNNNKQFVEIKKTDQKQYIIKTKQKWIDQITIHAYDTNSILLTQDGPLSPQIPMKKNINQLISKTAGLNIVLRGLDSRNFPFIYSNVAVELDSVSQDSLTNENFKIYENGIQQFDFFEVIPPQTGAGQRLVDIIICMDVSGSMLGEIDQVDQNVNKLLDDLKNSGIDQIGLGLIILNNRDPYVANNGILVVNDVEYFRTQIWKGNPDIRQYPNGSEYGYDALVRAANAFSFNPGAQKVLILITDESVIGNRNLGEYSKEQTINILKTGSFVTYTLIKSDVTSVEDYGDVAIATGGEWFNITDPFDQILLKIGSYVASSYIIRYKTDNPLIDGTKRIVKVEVATSGLTASVEGEYTPGTAPIINRTIETITLSENGQAQNQPIIIKADVVDNIQPGIVSVILNYRTTGTETIYKQIEMNLVSGALYQAEIPGNDILTPGIDYYITASDGESTVSSPTREPDKNPHQIAVLPNQKPVIVHVPVDTIVVGQNLSLSLSVSDNTNQIKSVSLYIRPTGTLAFEKIKEDVNATTFSKEINFPVGLSAMGVDYYIEATDDFGVTTKIPKEKDYYHVIYIDDITSPEFIVNILPNPVLSDLLDIYIYSSELLSEKPKVSIDDNLNDLVSMIPGASRLFVADYRLVGSKNYSLQVEGSDLIGNKGTFSNQFSAGKITVTTGGILKSCDNAMEIQIQENSINQEKYLIIGSDSLVNEEKYGLNLKNSEISKSTEKLESNIYFVLGYEEYLNKYASIKFSLDKLLNYKSTEYGKVEIQLFVDNNWRKLETYWDKNSRIAIAKTDCLGPVKLLFYKDITQTLLPEKFNVYQNYPNPFNSQTNITMELPKAIHVKVEIYDLTGKRIMNLIDKEYSAGYHQIIWNGKNTNGSDVSSGIYFIKSNLGERYKNLIKSTVIR